MSLLDNLYFLDAQYGFFAIFDAFCIFLWAIIKVIILNITILKRDLVGFGRNTALNQ